MTADAGPYSSLWWQGTVPQPSRLGRMLALSLALHLVVLIVAAGLKLPAKMERPLASYQVSLVTLPHAPAAPPVQQTVEADVPIAPPPAPAAPPPVPTPRVVKPNVTPAPVAPKPPTVPAPSKPQSQLKDLLRGIKLPPQAPALGDVAPAPKTAPIQRVQPAKTDPSQQKLKQEIDELLKNIAVPESQPAAVGPAIPTEVQAKQTLSQQMQNLTSQALKPVQDDDLLKRPAPIQQAKAAAKIPATKMQVLGVATGFNWYLAQVQRQISAQWIAPPVDLTGRMYRVVIKFRLDQSGSVNAVAVETSSGNGYFDDAATRAVLKADPLPPFPKDLAESSLDAHFSFVVGEEVG
ncbi:MAG: TonB family protein [Nitrospirota bacterium]|nr:TonB family protein [Nitrospirota bacterium]